ncbi:response regulator [Frigidibacter albus]|uniref:Response regulator n=1 Tax=Frigidibacter albus TaxID=1465486 RepID=A0A6L8VLD3_9RHOB|nr:response regulator [Frigidibacter albus]NBE32354.1 response regulator [Frigidibacter albus]
MSPTVMIVEDEFLLAMDVEAMLETNGYRAVGPAATVDQALDMLARQRPDIVLLDISLRGEWATPVAGALRKAGIPYLVMSAYSASELGPSGVLDGTRNIGKPVDERRLIGALAEVLASR